MLGGHVNGWIAQAGNERERSLGVLCNGKGAAKTESELDDDV